MPKLKTKKTLMKRIKITKTGKIMKKRTAIGHLKRKWDASKHSSKRLQVTQDNRGHQKLFKRLLGKAGKNIN